MSPNTSLCYTQDDHILMWYPATVTVP